MKGIAFIPGFIGGLFSLVITLPAMAQITSDGTTNTTINQNGNNFNILNGIQKGNNLFHSFKEFSIPTNGSATFSNSTDVVNIINRVTGGNISNIDGLIKANGSANLFLINPAGIVFGENARLDIGGSFLGSTAESILFEDGFNYSAIDSQQTPLLTISVPLGLQMGSNPGGINVQGKGHNLTYFGAGINRNASTQELNVQKGQTLALVGGDINLSGAVLTAEEGSIELGSLSGREFVNLSLLEQGLTFDYSQVSNLGNISLSQKSLVDTSGNPSGNISVQANKVSITEGSLVLTQNQGNLTGGIINVNATESLEISGFLPSVGINAALRSEALGTGNSGDISVSAGRLIIQDSAVIHNNTYSQGDSGSININVSESIQVRDTDPTNALSSISSTTSSSGVAGNVNVSTPDLLVANGAVVGSQTIGNGAGGNLTINAKRIQVSGNNNPATTALSTASLVAGNAGNLIINTDNLIVNNSGAVTSSSIGQGNAGNITINAAESIEVTGNLPKAQAPSQIRSTVKIPSAFAQRYFNIPAIPEGKGGNININTPSLKIDDSASLTVANTGIGDSGTININADSVLINYQGQITATTALGEGGNITLDLQDSLIMRNNSLIDTEALGKGNGGNITINSPIIAGFENSNIIANAVDGNGGNIDITTSGIFGLEFRDELTEESDITASSEFGVNGTVEINNISIDPSSGLTELPVKLSDSSQQIAAGCSTNNDNSFVATGKGGIPQNPNQYLTSNLTWSDFRDLSVSGKGKNNSSNVISMENKPAIVEATGFIRNENGEIELVAVDNTPLRNKQVADCRVTNT